MDRVNDRCSIAFINPNNKPVLMTGVLLHLSTRIINGVKNNKFKHDPSNN